MIGHDDAGCRTEDRLGRQILDSSPQNERWCHRIACWFRETDGKAPLYLVQSEMRTLAHHCHRSTEMRMVTIVDRAAGAVADMVSRALDKTAAEHVSEEGCCMAVLRQPRPWIVRGLGSVQTGLEENPSNAPGCWAAGASLDGLPIMLSGFRFSIGLVGCQPVPLTSPMRIPMEPECTPLRNVRVFAPVPRVRILPSPPEQNQGLRCT